MTITIIVLIGALIAAVIWANSKQVQINSFWDALRHPDSMRDLKKLHQEAEDEAARIAGSGPEIRRLIKDFVFNAETSDDAETQERVLTKLGKEVFPYALEILKDESVHTELVMVDDEDSSSEAPICRLVEILNHDSAPPLESTALLVPFLSSNSDEIRKSVALTIGSTGSPDALPALQRALKDADEYVKSYALMGIQRALTIERISRDAKQKFFDMVAEMWPSDTSFEVCDSIPNILLSLDPDRGSKRLLEPDLFTTEFEPVWRILEAFIEHKIDVPRPKLLTIIDQASKEPIKYPMDNVLEGALSLLGQHQMKEDLPTLERLVDHSNAYISNGAVSGLYSYHQYFDTIRDPWDVVDSDGWNALTQAEKHICAIEELDSEVNNGGFAQYFFNSAGDRWQDASAGLSAIGATERHGLLKSTLDAFGQNAPSGTRAQRQKQLSKIVRKKEDPFEEQDAAWYKSNESIRRLVLHYNLVNQQGRQKAANN